jgi:hypothetical protein
VPEQRIISEKLWIRTHERINLVPDLYGVAKGKRRRATAERASIDAIVFPEPSLF